MFPAVLRVGTAAGQSRPHSLPLGSGGGRASASDAGEEADTALAGLWPPGDVSGRCQPWAGVSGALTSPAPCEERPRLRTLAALDSAGETQPSPRRMHRCLGEVAQVVAHIKGRVTV